jgi:hypothetical protein
MMIRSQVNPGDYLPDPLATGPERLWGKRSGFAEAGDYRESLTTAVAEQPDLRPAAGTPSQRKTGTNDICLDSCLDKRSGKSGNLVESDGNKPISPNIQNPRFTRKNGGFRVNNLGYSGYCGLEAGGFELAIPCHKLLLYKDL